MADLEPTPKNTYQLYDPESWDMVFPYDDYNETRISFLALRDMGYPVELEGIHREDVPQHILEESSAAYYELHGSTQWVRPVVLHPDFEEWLESFTAPGTMINVGAEAQDHLRNHPAILLEQVDNSAFEEITEALCRLERDGSGIYPIVDTEFLERCLLAAFERFSTAPKPVSRMIARYAHERFERATAKGLSPITPNELGELVKDYYGLVELLRPDILRFKGDPPPRSEYEI